MLKSDLLGQWHQYLLVIGLTFSIGACGERPWNNPYPAKDKLNNTFYTTFAERPKHLDPVRSYSSNEYAIIAQVYEPPLQYHFLKRPYELIPLTATALPVVKYFDKNDRVLPLTTDVQDIAYSVYDIHIQSGIKYQPHPAFARDAQGQLLYHSLTAAQIADIFTLEDFAKTSTREMTADDYVYQIKRMAHPRLNSPIFGLMSDYIVGLKEYAKALSDAETKLVKSSNEEPYLELNQFDISGVQVLDRYTYRIKILGKYPQFLYWLAMPFFAPMPNEVDQFYAQTGLDKKNITLDWYPVGTGPYMLTRNNPNLQMVLDRNPNFHGERYPTEGEADDNANEFLADAGKPLPFIDRIVHSLEKESIPGWNKFLQGYYDASGISSDSFDQAIQFNAQGDAGLSEQMVQQGIQLITGVGTSTYYMGFNMRDPVVGGYSDRARKLRQAVSIAVDFEEYISIFANGRGISAQGPIPPGIFGYQEGRSGINPYVYDWVDGQPKRKSLADAKALLSEAGYPNGRDEQTGRPLILNYDTTASGPDDKALLDWYRKQLQKIDIQLVVRATDYNRFQEKMQKGTEQLFSWGWNADYPDPENFLFLLYGPNIKVGQNGENAANYANPEFDRLFERMKNMENSTQRQSIIDQMMEIARRDSPWIWGFHPKQFSLYHAWYGNAKPNLMANNTLKYKRINPQLRYERRREWNKPVLWPVVVLIALLFAAFIPAINTYRAKSKAVGVTDA